MMIEHTFDSDFTGPFGTSLTLSIPTPDESPRDFGDVYCRLDGSYVIKNGSLPYHVIVGSTQYSDVEAYIKAHPERVTTESPPQPPTLEELKQYKMAEIAEKRWMAETGGMLFNGNPIATDDRSKSLLFATYARASSDPNFKTAWKCADGVFREIDSGIIAEIYAALCAHLDACFGKEAVLVNKLSAAKTIDEVEVIQW